MTTYSTAKIPVFVSGKGQRALQGVAVTVIYLQLAGNNWQRRPYSVTIMHQLSRTFPRIHSAVAYREEQGVASFMTVHGPHPHLQLATFHYFQLSVKVLLVVMGFTFFASLLSRS